MLAAAGEENPNHRLDTFDGDPAQLSLAAFDGAIDALSPTSDSEVPVTESSLDRIAETVAELETLADGEPTLTADEWADLGPEQKAPTLSVRLRAIRGTIAGLVDDSAEDDAPPDWYR